MTKTEKILAECDRACVKVEPDGDVLLVSPSDNVTPELLQKIRANKRELLTAIEHRKRTTALHLSKQIFLGEFEGADDPTRRMLAQVLCSFLCPLTRRALGHLNLHE